MMMLPAFFARVNPVSTIAKPACMKNTSAAPIRNHTPNTSLVADSFTSLVISSIAIIRHLLSLFYAKQQIRIGRERPIVPGSQGFCFVAHEPEFGHQRKHPVTDHDRFCTNILGTI